MPRLAAPTGWRDAGALAGRGAVGRRRHGAVALGDAAPAAALKHGMGGDALAVLQDVDLGRGNLDLDDAASRAVGHGVEIAADRDHALARDPAFQAQHGVERPGWQRSEERPLLGEVLGHDPAGGGVHTAVGHLIEPLPELGVEVVEVAEGAGEEEVLAHVAEGPLHLALGLRPVGPARLGHHAVVRGQVQELGVVDDASLVDLAEDRRLHAVVEDLLGRAAQSLEGGDVAAENGGEVLAGDETGPHHAAVAEDEGEEPDDTLHPRLVSELGLEEGEVRLALLAGRGLKTTLKHLGWCRTDHTQELGDGGVAALKAELAELAPEAPPGQLGEALRPLPQIGLKGWISEGPVARGL